MLWALRFKLLSIMYPPKRIAVSVNETRSSAKLVVYSIAYNGIYTRLLQNVVAQFWRVGVSWSAGNLLRSRTETGYQDLS